MSTQKTEQKIKPKKCFLMMLRKSLVVIAFLTMLFYRDKKHTQKTHTKTQD